jgi:hypothetical protein
VPLAPYTYASALRTFSIGRELVPGQIAAPVALLPLDKMEPADDIGKIEDKALRGSMVGVYNVLPGVGKSALSLSGPVLADTFPWLLASLLGDVVYQGTANGAATALTQGTGAGANQIPVGALIAAGTQVQVDTGVLSEIRTVQTVTGAASPYTVTLTAALNLQHAGGVAVTPVGAPYTTLCAVMNSGGVQGQAQPATHTLTEVNGITAASGARQYSSFSIEEVTVKITPEGLIMHDSKAQAFLSSPAAAAPTGLAASNVPPTPGWAATIAVSGTQMSNISEIELVFKRVLEAIPTVDGSQNPLQLRRGPVDVSGKLTFIARDESPFLTYLQQTNVPLSVAVDNGITGAGQQHTQFDIAAAKYVTGTKLDAGKAAIAYQVEFDSLPAGALAGWTGGLSGVRTTSINAIAPGTYA